MGVMPLVTPSMMADAVRPALPVVPVQSAIDPAATFAGRVESRRAEGAGRIAGAEVSGAVAGSVVAAAGTEGDVILTGLQRLRSVFNDQESRIAGLMSGAYSDTETLLAMQMELTNFSILIDMTSKLASKAAQGLDTLMKGS